MDAPRFDHLSKSVGAKRRTVLGGLLAGLLIPLETSARKKGKNGKQRKRQDEDKARKRAQAQEELCWRAGACLISTGSNVSRCDLADYDIPDGLDCTRCNLSRANLRGADLTGVNLTRANLSGACLVDVDFTDATFTSTTNLYNAIFCRTIMPNGSVNDSGCGSGTACCPTTECLATNEGQPCHEGVGICRAGVCSRAADTCICGDESQPMGCVRPTCVIQGSDDEAEVEALCLRICADRGGWSGEWLCVHVEECPV